MISLMSQSYRVTAEQQLTLEQQLIKESDGADKVGN